MGVDRSAVRAGALVALALFAPTILLAWIVDAVTDIEGDDPIAAVLFVPVIVGFVLAGWVAGRRERTRPFVHATVAALAAYAVVALLALVRLTAFDSDVQVGAFVFNAFLASGLGLLGATAASVSNAKDFVAERRERAERGLPDDPTELGSGR